MSFVDGIKRIRDKTFCFDIRLGPNPHTRHTSHIHGAGCNFGGLRGIRMSKVSPFLLEKWAMTSSLYQNLFCDLNTNGEWLTILESLRKKKKTNKGALWANPKNNKRIQSLWCPSRVLALNFSGRLIYFVFFTSCSTFSSEALASGWPWSLSLSLFLPFFYSACMFNSLQICARAVLIIVSTRGGEISLRIRYV